MNGLLPSKIYDVLNDVAKGDIQNFAISVHDSNKKGEGYLGQMFFVSLKDKRNGNQLNIVVKQAFSEENIRIFYPIRDVFLTEIYFYTKLWPRLRKFQEAIPSNLRFEQVGTCLAAVSKEHLEALVMENLKYQGFVLQDKKYALGRDKFEFIFKVYGRFHATSFAYKELHPEEFSELVEEVTNVWKTFGELASFKEAIKLTHEQSLESLQPGVDDEVIEKYKHYVDDGVELFLKSLVNGKYVCITHGDCWSNNMMFKYDDSGKLIDLRLLDFQMFRPGSPVCDLAYCLYSGGTKAIFDDLDHFLRIYYDSLSENLRAFGCDPEEVYPFDAMKEEWKVASQLGFAVGMMVWRGKLTYEDDAVDLSDLTDDQDVKRFFQTKYDKETFQRTMREIVLHINIRNPDIRHRHFGKLTDVRFLDFQMSRIGSPVCDLSYCLYSGAAKEVLDDLDYLLQVYHDSFSENLRAYGCDPDELYPLDVLKEDWKVHSQFGITMGLMLWRAKLTYDDEVVDLSDMSQDKDGMKKFFEANYDDITFKRIIRDLITHVYKNDYLI